MPPPPPNPSEDREARTQRHLAVLDTLIAQGVDLATRLHQQSTTPSDLCTALAAPGVAIPFITPDVIAAFAQINQTVRRAILVSRKLAEPFPLARPKSIKSQPEHPGPRDPEPAHADTVRTGFADRLHSPDLEDRIGNRPIHEIIAEISRDLAVISANERARRTPEDMQAQIARAAGPTSPAPHPRPGHTNNAAKAEVTARHDYVQPECRRPNPDRQL